VLLGVIDYGMPLEEAVFAPRIHEQARPDTLKYEDGALSQPVLDSLAAMGYATTVSQFHPGGFVGRVIAIGRTKNGWVGVVDRRTSGGAAGY
jgi:gamma-glutamyltranspeptidase/glutathione hydrolase